MKYCAPGLLIFVLSISAAAQIAADVVIVNGNIRTLDAKVPIATAAAIKSGRFIAVGGEAEIKRHIGPDTEVIDAGRRLIVPGFNDSHVHFTGIGNIFSHLQLASARSAEDIVAGVARFTAILPKGRWAMGGGLTTAAVPLDRLPSLEQIDAVSRDNAVIIYIDGYKSALVNSAALKAAGLPIDAAKPPIVSGALVDRVRNSVPRGHETNWSEIALAASNFAASLGVTSVQDVHSDDLADILNGLDGKGLLKTRVYDCIGIRELKKLIDRGPKAAAGNAMVRTGCVKTHLEGDEGEIDEQMAELVAADRAGSQIMIHAIGGRSISNAISAVERLEKLNGKRDRRVRIEHAARMRAEDRPRFVRSSVIASMQPFLFWPGDNAQGDDIRSLVDAGVRVALGSDASIAEFDPLLAIHAAVNAGRGSLTVEEAVRAHTVGSAFAEYQESEKGTISVGKLADMVMLTDDIFTIEKRRIRDVRAVTTIVGGRVVYKSSR
jgi:predicted amidohydrolase YtcJ